MIYRNHGPPLSHALCVTSHDSFHYSSHYSYIDWSVRN